MIIMGRDRKSKRSSAASCGMMMPQMAMMMPQAAPASRDSTSSDEEKDKTPALDPRCAVRSSTMECRFRLLVSESPSRGLQQP